MNERGGREGGRGRQGGRQGEGGREGEGVRMINYVYYLSKISSTCTSKRE